MPIATTGATIAMTAVMTDATTAATTAVTAAITTEIGRSHCITRPGAAAHSGRPLACLRAHQLELRVTVSHTPRVTR
jgi:hypothetical protein